MIHISNIQVRFENEQGVSTGTVSLPVSQYGVVLDEFCQLLVAKGVVDEIHYTREFSLIKETTKKLEGQ